jgi:hypothetical protein
MSWSISYSGSANGIVAATASQGKSDASPAAAAQIAGVRAQIAALEAALPADAYVSLSASGHDGSLSSSVSVTIPPSE